MTPASGKQRLDWILSPEPALDLHGPGAGLVVGVLALQGDFREHRLMLERLGARTREVRKPSDLAGLDGLVIPGGESTTIHKLMSAYELAGPIQEFAAGGGVVYGTCAGLITVARETVEGAPPTLGLMDIVARRNAFGRQVRSFEADLEVAGLGASPVRAVFIRAPWVESAGPGVEVLATCRRPHRRRARGRRARHRVPPRAHRRLASARAVHPYDPPPAGTRRAGRRARPADCDAGAPGRAAAAAGHR